MRTGVLGGLLFLFVPALAGAQALGWPRENPPPPLEARDVDFPPYEIRTLPNGLQVVAVLHHEQPVVSLRLLVRAGSASDPADKLGLANLTASLLNQGTETMTAEAFADEIDFIGAAAGAGAGTDLTFVNIIAMTDSFGRGMQLLADMARRPAFVPAEIERQRQQTLSSLQVSLQDPAFVADAVFDRLVYGFHPYGLPASGTPGTLGPLTRADVSVFHQQYFVPNNAILAIVGDVTAADAFAEATRVFGDWVSRPVEVPARPAPPEPTRRVIVVNKPDAVQTEVRVGQIGISRQTKDFVAVDLLLRILGGEGSNRLHQVLRNERSLTYGASADLHARKAGGDFEAETNTRSEATAEVLQVMVDQFSRLQRETVRGYELEGAKAYMTGNFPLSIETPDAIALQVLNSLFYDTPLEELETLRDRVGAVTTGDLQRHARALLHPDRLSIVLVGNAEAFSASLRAAGFDSFEVVELDQLDLLAADFRRKPGSPRQGAGLAAPRVLRPPVAAYQPGAPGIAQGREGADAFEVLEAVIAAKGGRAALEAVQGLRATAVAPFVGPRGEAGEVETTTWLHFPNQVRIETRLPDAEIVQVYDGHRAWIRDPRGVHDVPDDVVGGIEASLQRDTIPLLIAATRGRLDVRRLQDVRDESGAAQRVLEFTGEGLGDQQPLILYADAATGRITRQTYPSGVPGAPLIEEAFSDYRDVAGVQIPFAAVVTRGGEPLAERRVSDVAINPPADPERFSRP